MDTKKIRVILSAIKNKSLSRAAEEFSYTASALSHMADSVEKELGVRIIKRTSSGISLTEAGEQLYEKLVHLLDAEKELLLAAEQLSNARDSELRIGTYSSISMNILPEILKLFKKEHPEIRVSIAVRDKFKGWLEEGNADVIFASISALGENECVLTIKDRFMAIVPEDKLVGKDTVIRDELYDYPYISTNQSVLRKYFDEKRFSEIIHFDSTDDMAVVSMVKEGIGIAVLPTLVVKSGIEGVRTLTLVPEISRELGFAYNKGADNTSATKKFIDFIKRNAYALENIANPKIKSSMGKEKGVQR